jgi:muramidase (phage lysozyme)|tara:strand:- start:3883 stop:5610 length:1728 start_codon:yes stop_codon:yes gene_type:complete
MAVSNLPNLSIAAPKSTGKIGASNLSGGNTLGSGIVQSAANNIAGFKKPGTSSVSPRIPNIASLLQTISNTVTNQVQNLTSNIGDSIKGAVTNVTNLVGPKKEEDDKGPNKIMSEFLKLYDKALDYVKFFANPKQIKNFDLAVAQYNKELQGTSDLVVNIRKFIKKMIKDFLRLKGQLLSGGGGGGLPIPLPIPGLGGGKAKPQAKPRARMPRIRGRGGAALLGLGLLGGGAAAAKMIGDSQSQNQEVQFQEVSKEIITKFNSVLERFESAIDGFTGLGGGSGDPKGKSGPTSKDTDDTSGTGAARALTPIAEAPNIKTAIRRLESGNDYSSMYNRNRKTFSRGGEDITKMTIQQVHDLQTDYLDHQAALGYDEKNRSAAMGAYQMLKVREVAVKMGFDPNKTLFNQETQDRMADYYLNYSGFQDFKAGKITAEEFNNRLAGQFASVKQTSGVGVYDNDGMNSAYGDLMPLLLQFKSGTKDFDNVLPPGVKAIPPDQGDQKYSPTMQMFLQQIPGSNTIQTLPGVDPPPPPPQEIAPGVQMPAELSGFANLNLTPENPDNWLPLYSKATMNIIDR